MVNGKDIKYNRRTVCVRIASLLLALMFAVMFASPQFVFAEEEKSQDKPLREVHKVGIQNGVYCFFVQHNVVLTPEDIRSRTDEELTAFILDKAGLYIKEANCRLAKHKAIQAKDWPEKNGVLFLSAPDINTLREIEPADGAPVKMYMDLMISKDNGKKDTKDTGKTEETAKPSESGESAETGETGESAETAETGESGESGESGDSAEPADEKDQQPYSTYKKISPELIFVAVATEADAASGEDICIEEATDESTQETAKPTETVKPKVKKQKPTAAPSAPSASEEEMLPELRTINMTDRSGPPIEETLKDGSPVSLEWIEPKQNGYEGEASFTDRIPGGIAGLAVMAAVAAAAVIAVIFEVKRKEKEE